MTHSPPIPPGNQSPYPLQEPPHDHAGAQPDIAAPRTPSPDEPMVSGAALGIGVAIGLGSAALFAAWLFKRNGKAKPAARKSAARGNGNSRAKSGGRASTSKPRSTAPRRRKTPAGDK